MQIQFANNVLQVQAAANIMLAMVQVKDSAANHFAISAPRLMTVNPVLIYIIYMVQIAYQIALMDLIIAKTVKISILANSVMMVSI